MLHIFAESGVPIRLKLCRKCAFNGWNILHKDSLMFEMLVFIFGEYAFVFGSVNLPWNLSVSGWRARVAALFLMAPLPILILIGRVVGQGIDENTALSFFGMLELVIVLLGILGAALIVYLTRPNNKKVEIHEEEGG